MLTSEEATRRLDSLKDPQWRDATAKRVSKLPSGLRDMAEAFIAPEPHHQWDASGRMVRNQRHLAAGRELDGLPAGDRARVMAALHPGLGAALARWWTEAQGRPYLRQWDRKAFRAPGAPGLTVDGRAADLMTLLQVTGPYEADPVWLAIWGGHLAAQRGGAQVASLVMGSLLASAIDGEAGEETLVALTEVANGEHPAGIMGQHVIVALLGASRPAGWELIERLLLAAQLQEGLRQSILEAADEGHPAAFDRMLSLVLDKKLLRFASSVRAVGVWLGFGANVADIPAAEARVRALARYRSSEADRLAALASPDPWEAYVALCVGGVRDVLAALPEVQQLAVASSPDLRATALRYAAETRLQHGQELIGAALDDPDIRVASFAASLLTDSGLGQPGTFDALARLVERSPGTASEASGLGIQQSAITISQVAPAGLLARAAGGRPASDLLPWLPYMDAHGRAAVAALMAGEYRYGYQRREPQELTAELRPVMISLLSDRSSHVRSIAIRALTKTRLAPAEAPAIEALLTRAATDIRRGALTLLTSLAPAAARESASRLAASADKRQRESGAELLREIGGSDPAVPDAAEDLHVALAVDRAAPAQPRMLDRPAKREDRDQAAAVLAALGDLAHEHRDVTVTITTWQGGREMLLGDVKSFPSPFHHVRPAGHPDPADDDGPLVAPMLLGEVFRGWWDTRPAAVRGEDEGLDALHAYILAQPEPAQSQVPPPSSGLPGPADDGWWRKLMGELTADAAPKGLHHPALVEHVTRCLVAEHANGRVIDECLDVLEVTLSRVPGDVLAAPPDEDPRAFYSFGHYRHLPRGDWRHRLNHHPWLTLLSSLLHTRPALFTPAQAGRWYRLMRWVEQPHRNAQPMPVPDLLLAAAHAAGAASDDDVAIAFLWPHSQLFKNLTRHWRAQFAARYPALIPVADRVRDAVVAVETRRGDLPTPTSGTAGNISSVHGVTTVARLLASLGATQLARGWTRGSDGKDAIVSHLVRVSFPAVGETGDDLKAAARAASVSDARLVDLALYAPQWALPVEGALGWPGLAAGVLWLHAHTKDRQWSIDPELRDSWHAMTAERTALGGDDLVDGAVDVEWFRQAYAALGARRWAVVSKAAKHASGGNGHRRAQVFAEAMLGQADEAAVAERITGKRNQDAVRALGLLPLPGDEASRRSATQRRYVVLREFERGIKAFGAQRQASEKTAVRIGIENLARTAGYPDPLRFTWAVEAREAGDLADGPVTVTAADVSFTLSVDVEGVPDLTVSRAGKQLKSVPAALKKDPDVVALQARKTALARQATRVRQSLEAAMVAQDAFTAADVAELRRHPVVAPMLRQLVWVEQDGRTRWLDDGSRLDGPLRIAHPVDLVTDGSWVAWQQRLFADARRQPFKQVFRELYAKTAQELTESPVSRRYTGQQLQPRQALALLGNRGWLTSQESGEATRVFHRHGFAARVTFDNGFLTAAEADLPSVDGAYFSKRGEWAAQPLGSVPDVVFSEAMRDLDLVVSVAHAGGVDPEATASTTQMRAALIRETARLLKLANIEFVGASHVIITGRLGEYSLHLGSGTVHRRPGGAVCIIPVGSQHRGRLFLPFADDDPKTAEIVSKALLLARDHEIKDPAILQQLRS